MKKSIIVILIILVVIGGAVVYLGSKAISSLKNHAGDMLAEKMIGAATHEKVKINQGGKTVTINGVTVKQGLPDNFPKDFPMYAKAQVTGSMGKGAESTTTISIIAPQEDVAEFYASNLKEKGWTVKESTLGELTTLEIAKDNLKGNVTITKDKSKTLLLLNFKPAK